MIANIDKEIQQCIIEAQKELNNYYKNCNDKLIELNVLRIQRRSFSITIFLDAVTTVGINKLVMKKIVHDPINISITTRDNQALVEFELLTKLHPMFCDSGRCYVPKPILVIPRLELFIMEFVEGKHLSVEFDNARYWGKPSDFERLAKYYYMCGEWLNKFHKFTGIETASSVVFEDLLDRCEIRLGIIEEMSKEDSLKGIRAKVINFMKQQLSLLANEGILIAGRHGDFGHWNIITNSESLTVIDFMGYTKEPIPYDIIKMLLSLEYWGYHVAYSKPRLNTLKMNFLNGYGSTPKVQQSVLVLCETYHRVASLYAILTNVIRRIDLRVQRYFAYKQNISSLNKMMGGHIVWPSSILL